MAIVGHVFKRLLLALLGYAVALVASLVALALIYAAASSVPGVPDRFTIMAVSPYVALAVPSLGLFALILAAVLTAGQTTLTVLLSEIFRLRSLWVHMLFGALVSGSAYLMIAPVAATFAQLLENLEGLIFAASGAVGGVVYWAIAGRGAGFRLG